MSRVVSFLLVLVCSLLFAPIVHAQSFSATTTVVISVCGDGNPDEPGKVCDDGVNNGEYSTSTAGRNCMPGCGAWAPYCGDGILQQVYGEQCDSGALNGTPGSGCSATCQIESLAPLPGPGPSGGGGIAGGSYTPPQQTQVIVEGRAYPDASVNILDDGTTIGVVQADSSANFYFSTTNVSPGITTFGFWAQDASGMKSIALTTTFTVTADAVTTVSGEFLPPTISIDKRQLSQGDTLTISGQSAPLVTVEAQVHSANEMVITTSSDTSGNWKMLLDTGSLANNAFHTVQADFVTNQAGAIQRSTLSQSISFYLGAGSIGTSHIADLNGDGKVNLADFSILLYYWGTNYPPAEFDGGSVVDLADFSILLYNWTG